MPLTNNLEESIKRELKKASTLTPGTKEKASAIRDVKTLYELKLAEDRQREELAEKKNARIAANRLKARELELEERKEEAKEMQEAAELELKKDELQSKIDAEKTKNKQDAANEKKHRVMAIVDVSVKLVLGIASVAVPALCYMAVTTEGFRFEQTGVISSGMFKNTLNRINPTKF